MPSKRRARRMRGKLREEVRQLLKKHGLAFPKGRTPVPPEAYHDLDHDLEAIRAAAQVGADAFERGEFKKFANASELARYLEKLGSRESAIERMRARKWKLPADYKFDRDETNSRDGDAPHGDQL
jgi:hypothetical protein